MKKIIYIVIACLLVAHIAEARYQKGYWKPSTGTYVSGHFKTTPDSTKLNNYSAAGNTNPFTGTKGYKSPYNTPSYKTPSYKPKKYKY